MADFPVVGSFLPGAGSNESRCLLLEEWLKACKSLPGGAEEQALQIAGGSIRPRRHFVQIDTERFADSDTLDRIDPGELATGSIVTVRITDPGRQIMVKHKAGGENDISLVDGTDWWLTGVNQRLTLYNDGSQWVEVSRSWGAAKVRLREWLELQPVVVWGEASAEDAVAGTRGEAVMTPRRVSDAMSSPYAMMLWRPAATDARDDDTLLVARRNPDGTWFLQCTQWQYLIGDAPRRMWSSGELGIGAGASGAMAHGLGGRPTVLQPRIRCATAEHGFSAGDEVVLDNGFGAADQRLITIGCNGTDVFYRVPSNAAYGRIAVVDGAGVVQPITAANWRLVIRAWR